VRRREAGGGAAAAVAAAAVAAEAIAVGAIALLAAAGCGDANGRGAPAVAVHAAPSLAAALEEIAGLHRIRTGDAVETAFGPSSVLAQRIDEGAQADVFLPAGTEWMDRLVGRGRIRAGSVVELAGNALVIVAPASAPFSFALGDSGGLPAAFEGHLAIGDPLAVQLGAYARQSLEHAGWWKALEPRLVGAADARAALELVERGECAAGIVYASDALGSERARVVERIPDEWHDPIVYPAGLVEGRSLPAAERFLDTLRSPEAARILRKHGFRVGAGAGDASG
jgi:molybdate transport system substrate-binding protein